MATVTTKEVTLNTSTGRDASPGDGTLVGNARWWDRKIPEGDGIEQVHHDVVPYVQTLMTAWARHDWFDRCHDRIYENRALLSQKKALSALSAVGFNPSRLMVTTNIVDTFHSRFERRRPMPMIVVDDATYDLKRQAQEFQSFLRGRMRDQDVDSASSGALKDSCVRGTGIVYIDEGDDDIIVEKVHRWELFVDPHEAAAGFDCVRQMHRVRRVAKEVLAAMYPHAKKAIMEAPPARRRDHETGAEEWASPVGLYAFGDMVDVYLSWHLPSCAHDEADKSEDKVDDGRKALCIEGATLCFERYERPRFPFAVLRRHVRQDGFWGQGDVERLASDQHDINKIATDIQRNVEMDGHLKVFTPQAMDNTPTEKLSGRGPFRIRYPGATPPAFVPPNPVSPAHLAYLEKRIAWMHDMSGVSQWSATGRSPLGAGASGVALDTMEDLQSDRHASFEARYSRWRCEVAQLIIDAARAVAKRYAESDGDAKKKYAATWMEHGTMRRIEWESVAIRDEQYRLDVEPVSFLPSTRAGKIAAIKELMELGGWQPTQVMELFDEPDLATANRETLAPIKNARRVMALLGDPTKEAPVPEPQWNLALHLEMAKSYYQLAQCDGAPEEVQARYRDYADLVQDELDKAKGAAPPQPEMPGMPPEMAGAMPGPEMPPMGPEGMPPGAPMPPMPMAAGDA